MPNARRGLAFVCNICLQLSNRGHQFRGPLPASGHPWNPLDPCHDWLVCWHNGHITINTPAPPHPIQTIHNHMRPVQYSNVKQPIQYRDKGNTMCCQCQYKHACSLAGERRVDVYYQILCYFTSVLFIFGCSARYKEDANEQQLDERARKPVNPFSYSVYFCLAGIE